MVREQLGLPLLHAPGPGQHRRDGPPAGHRSLVERAAQEDVHAAGPLHDGRRHAAALRRRHGLLGPERGPARSSRRITPTKTRRSCPCLRDRPSFESHSSGADRPHVTATPPALESMVVRGRRPRDPADQRPGGPDRGHDVRPLRRLPRPFRQAQLRLLRLRPGTGRRSRPGPQPGLSPAHPQRTGTRPRSRTTRCWSTARARSPRPASCCCSSREPTTPRRPRAATRPIPACSTPAGSS